MKTDELYKSYDVHHWLKYNPHEGHYAKYDPNTVAVGFKIHETYGLFCNARTLLACSESKDFGDISGPDDLSKRYLASTFLQSALATYNYCIDLSWQVAWFYCAPSDAYYLIDEEKEYIDYSKKCTFDILGLKLRLGKKTELANHLNAFYSNDLTKKIRSEYNYLKHRGSHHTPGLGEQRSHMIASIDGEQLKLLQRNVFDIDEWFDKLFEFDQSFTKYFEKLIGFTVPHNFPETPLDLFAPIEYYMKKKNYLGKPLRV